MPFSFFTFLNDEKPQISSSPKKKKEKRKKKKQIETSDSFFEELYNKTFERKKKRREDIKSVAHRRLKAYEIMSKFETKYGPLPRSVMQMFLDIVSANVTGDVPLDKILIACYVDYKKHGY